MNLEQRLTARIRRQRWVSGIVTAVAFVLFIVLYSLYLGSRQVEFIGTGHVGYEKVTHDPVYGILAVLTLMACWLAFCFWSGTWFCRCVSYSCGRDQILVYRAMLSTRLYINGQEADIRGPIGLKYTLEGRLSDGSTLTVALGRYRAVKLLFSNGMPSAEL